MLVTTARSGLLRDVAGFATEDPTLRRGARLVVRTERGTETGEVLIPPTAPDAAPHPAIRGAVIRRATKDDLAREEELLGLAAKKHLELGRRLWRELGLAGKVVAVEHLFGGERIVFYFKAEARVELRALAKAVAAELTAAVDFRQVGLREEARLLGDFGPCGRALCARAFLRSAEPVTLRAIASQREALLDPTKLAGACGLLKDCLAFEDATYREAKRALPELGARCRTAKHGAGEVIAHETLAGRVRVRLESGLVVALAAAEIEVENPK